MDGKKEVIFISLKPLGWKTRITLFSGITVTGEPLGQRPKLIDFPLVKSEWA